MLMLPEIEDHVEAAVSAEVRPILDRGIGHRLTREVLVCMEHEVERVVRRYINDRPVFVMAEARNLSQSATMKIDVVQWCHDCDACQYLGRAGEDNAVDLYSCNKGPLPTFIARFSDEPSDYRSGAVFAAIDPLIAEAKRRHDRPWLDRMPER